MHDKEAILDEIRALALEAAKEDRAAAAMELLHGYLQHRIGDGFAWFRFGDLLREMGLNDEGERAMLTALETTDSERHGQIFLWLGTLHHDAGRYGQAEDFYRRACEDATYGKRGLSWILRGGNLAAANDLAKAEECHRKALTFFDKHVDRDEANLNLGYVLRAQGRYGEAREAFRNALEITPDYVEALEGVQSVVGVEEAMGMVKQLAEGD